MLSLRFSSEQKGRVVHSDAQPNAAFVGLGEFRAQQMPLLNIGNRCHRLAIAQKVTDDAQFTALKSGKTKKLNKFGKN